MSTDWQVVHRALVSVAARRSALDAEEARLLRDMIDTQVWSQLGMVSPLDYLERTLGYAPRTASERLRVATKLAQLPALEHALERGALCFSAVKELSRIATANVEEAWLAWAADKTVREIELKVAGHAEGDHPADDEMPGEVRNQRVVLDLPPEIYARWRQAQAVMSDEHGRRLDDAAFVAALLEAALDSHAGTGEMGKERYQIAISQCGTCRSATQEGGGRQIPIGETALARASCDAIMIGSLDGDGPERASRSIRPALRRWIMHRDGRCCRIPGCRSSKSLDLHHLEHRAAGGQHVPDNLISTCDSCHRALHDGRIFVGGTSSNLIFKRIAVPLEAARADSSVIDLSATSAFERPKEVRAHVDTKVRNDARSALVALGFAPAIARAAVAAVDDGPIEEVLRAALKQCPRPRG